MTDELYEAGERVNLYADIFPAGVSPRPDGVPVTPKIRALITEKYLTILWSNGAGPSGTIVGRMDIELADGEAEANANFRGGTVAGITVVKGGGCGCGANGLRGYKPFPAQTLLMQSRSVATPQIYGVPPSRYARR